MISPDNFHVRMLCCYWSFIIQRYEQLKFVILEIWQPIGHLNFLPRTSSEEISASDGMIIPVWTPLERSGLTTGRITKAAALPNPPIHFLFNATVSFELCSAIDRRFSTASLVSLKLYSTLGGFNVQCTVVLNFGKQKSVHATSLYVNCCKRNCLKWTTGSCLWRTQNAEVCPWCKRSRSAERGTRASHATIQQLTGSSGVKTGVPSCHHKSDTVCRCISLE